MKIKIFVRHCNFSSNSVGKNRPEWFSILFISMMMSSMDVLKNMEVHSLQLKKLIYLYVMNYSKTRP